MSKLETMVSALLLTHARVHSVEDVSEHFRRVLLEPPGKRSFEFRPGDKVQVLREHLGDAKKRIAKTKAYRAEGKRGLD